MCDLAKPRISLKFLTNICHFFNATLFLYKKCSLTVTFFRNTQCYKEYIFSPNMSYCYDQVSSFACLCKCILNIFNNCIGNFFESYHALHTNCSIST